MKSLLLPSIVIYTSGADEANGEIDRSVSLYLTLNSFFSSQLSGLELAA